MAMTLQIVSDDYEQQMLTELHDATGMESVRELNGWGWSLSAFSPAVRSLAPLEYIPDLGILGEGINGKVQ